MVFDGAAADTAAIVVDTAHITADAANGVLHNDTGIGALTVQGVAPGATAGPLSSNVNSPVVGTYGSLDIQANGSYDYVLNNTAAQAIHAGTTVNDTFSYTMKDAANATSTTTLTVAITGVNETPTAVADTAIIAATDANVTGNVLTNDTDGDADADDTLTVSAIATGSAPGGTIGAVGTALTGAYGSLTVNADGSYSYALDTTNAAILALPAGQTLTDNFYYTAKDTANDAASSTLAITIDGVNKAPVLTPATVTLSQPEYTTAVYSVSSLLTAPGGGSLYTDINGTTDGIAITAAPAVDAGSGMTGVWKYELGNSGVWTDFPTVSAANALLLSAADHVEYVVATNPHTDSQNSGSVALTYTVWDGSTGMVGDVADTSSRGGTTAFATGSETAAMNVTPVNTPPVFSSTTLTVNESSINNHLTGSFTNDSTQSGSGNLQLYDANNTINQILYRVEQLPVNGTLTLNGATLAVGSLFSQADVSHITYTPTIGELSANTTDSVYFTIRDGAGGVIGIDAPAGTTANIASWAKLDINILDVNAQIAISGTSMTIAEDNAHPGVAVTTPVVISLSDADDPNNLRTLTVTSLPAATFGMLQYWNGSSYQTATTGLVFTQAQLTDAIHPALQFVYNNTTEPTDQNGVLIPAQSQTSFTVSASDNNNHLAPTTATATININITPANDAPVLATHDLTVIQGSAKVITGDANGNNIYTTDPDSPAGSRTYTITATPAQGTLMLNGMRLGRGSTFTEAQLTGGLITYKTNDPYYLGADSVSVIATDGNGGTSNAGTININIAPPTSGPAAIAPVDNSPPSIIPGDHSSVSVTGSLSAVVPESLFVTLGSGMLSSTGTNAGGVADTAGYTVDSKPAHGDVYLGGVKITSFGAGGTSFTQAQIDNGVVVYLNDGSEPDTYGTPFQDTIAVTAASGTASLSETLTITVTPVADIPTITQAVADASGHLNQGGTALMQQNTDGTNGMATADINLTGIVNAVKLTAANFSAQSADTVPNLTYIVDSAVGGSVAVWNGSHWNVVTQFTPAQLLAGDVAYFHSPTADVAAPGDTTMTGSVTVHLINGAVLEAGTISISGGIFTEANSATVTNADATHNTLTISKDSAEQSPTSTVTFTVTNVNNAPVAVDSRFTVTEYSSGFGATPLASNIQVLTPSLLSVTDSDTANTHWIYTLTALPTWGNLQKLVGSTWTNITATNTTFTYADLSGGSLRYVNTGNVVIGSSNWSLAQDSFKFQVNDGETGSLPNKLSSAIATVSIFLRPTNQPPIIAGTDSGNPPLGVLIVPSTPEGGALKITSTMLGSPTTTVVDPDNSADQVQYRITGNVGNGVIYLGNAGGDVVKQLSAGSVFTLADIQNGRIWYQNNGSDPAGYGTPFTDSFNYVVSDASGMTEPPGTFLINILPVNQAPVVTGLSGGATFTEGGTFAVPDVLPLLIDSSVVLTNSDITDAHLANASASFLGGSLTIGDGFTGDKTFDQLSIQDSGAGAGVIGYTAATGAVTYGGVQIGSVILAGGNNGANGNSLSINLNANADIPAVQALMAAITFNQTNYDNAVVGTRTLTYTLVDGGGTSSSTNINGTPSFSGASYTDSKGVHFAGNDTWTGTATVNVVAANDRPVLTPNTGGGNIDLGTITEDNTSPPAILVSSFINPVVGTADATHTGISDVDTGAVSGIAITGLTNAATGTWQYSTDGTHWNPMGTVSPTQALLLAPTDSIRFVPDTKDGGTATITYAAWDQTAGTVGSKADTTSALQISAFSSGTDIAQVIVTPINDAPTLTGVASNTVTATEDTPFNFTGANSITLADVDAGNHLIQLTLTLTGGGTYGFSSIPSNVGTNADGSHAPALTGNTGTLVLYGTQADLNAAVGKLQYLPALNANQNNAIAPTLALSVDDLGYGVNGASTGIDLIAGKTITINITPVNDPPTLAVAAATLTVAKGSSLNTVANSIVVGDPSDMNDSNYAAGSNKPYLVITATYGTLALNPGFDFAAHHLTALLSPDGKILTLTSTDSGGIASLADINNVNTNQYLEYTPPTAVFAGIDTLNVIFHDNGNAGGGDLTASGAINVVIDGANTAPSFGALTATPTFTENGSAVVLDSIATLADSQLSVYNNWGGAVLTLARSGGATADDVFGLTGSGSTGVNFNGGNVRIAGSNVGTFTNSNGQLQITFNDGVTTAQAEQILQAITYSNGNNNPPGTAVINYTINDGNTNTGDNPQGAGGALTGFGSITVNIIAVNDPPTLTGLSAKGYTEDGSAVVIGAGAIPADPELSYRNDWGGATLTLSRAGGANTQDVFSASGTLSSLSAANGSFNEGGVTLGTYTNSGGVLTLTFAGGVTTAQAQAVMREIAYSNTDQTLAAGATTPVTLNWVLNDQNSDVATGGGTAGAGQDQGGGGKLSVTTPQVITLTGVNDAPVLAHTALTVIQTEDAPAPNGAVGVLVSTLIGGITDVDSGNPKGVAIVAADTSMGSWLYSTNNGTSWQALPAVANNHALLLNPSDRLYFQPAANVNGAVSAGLTIRAWDQSSGTAGGFVDATANGGNTAFSTATDSVSLTVTAVNDPPSIVGLPATSPNLYIQSGPAVVLENVATLADQELVTERNNWNGATLTIARQGAASVDDQFGATGSLSLNAGNVLVGGINIGSYSNTGGSLQFSFTSSATAALVNTALQNITYSNAVITPGALSYNSVKLDVTINDQNSNNTGGGTAGNGQDQGSGGLLTAVGTITVNIDRLPVAHADTAGITEDASPNTVTGIVITNDTDQDGDTLAVQGVVAGTQSGPVNTHVGNAVTGSYGSITLAADGSYTYTLDNSNAIVNGLSNGQHLNDIFTYTINDGKGGTSTTTLTVTINGHTDAAPTIVPVDGNAAATGQVTVNEVGLTSVGDTSETHTGSLTLSALDGLTSINVGGTAVTLTQLTNLGATPITINTAKGTITLTGYSSTTNVGGISTGGTLSYSYTLTQVQNTPGATENTDAIALSILSAGGDTNTGTLTVRIINDVPTANPDTASILEGSTAAVTGNVVTTGAGADRIGADATATPVTAVSFGGSAKTVGAAFASTYGSLTLNADGNYSYTLDNANTTVNALKNGQTLTETFNYTITDSDGNSSSTTLTITINGTNHASNLTPGSVIEIANPTLPLNPFTGNSSPEYFKLALPTNKNDLSLSQPWKNLPYEWPHYDLSLIGSLRNQLVLEMRSYSFTIPRAVFHHSNPNEQLEFKATTPSGQPLPAWLKFDPKTLTFSGVPPVGAHAETVMITAKDSNGQAIFATFTVGVNKDNVDRSDTIPHGNLQHFTPDVTGHKNGPPKPGVQGRLNNQFDTIPGKPGFTDQVHAVGKLSRLQESHALLNSLKSL